MAAAFVVLFAWQRSRSTVLRIEGERTYAATMAQDLGELYPWLRTADVMALYDMSGADGDRQVWSDQVNEFCVRLGRARQALGLGGLVPPTPEGPGHDRLLAAAVRDMTGDEIAVRRFLVLRERFAMR